MREGEGGRQKVARSRNENLQTVVTRISESCEVSGPRGSHSRPVLLAAAKTNGLNTQSLHGDH